MNGMEGERRRNTSETMKTPKKRSSNPPRQKTVLSVMLAVPDTPKAVDWYEKAFGARVLWSLGSVAGLEIDGAPFFLHESVKNGFDSPKEIGTTTVRVEFVRR